MKKRYLPSLALAAILLSLNAGAQKNTAYAITGQTKGNFNWNVIREIDLSTGEVVRTIYDPSENKTVNYKAVAGSDVQGLIKPVSPTGGGVAAAAFDALHNRLYFTSMHGDDLMYFDFNSQEQNVVVNNSPSFNTGSKMDEGNVITRMAFGSDGFGYALTNNGKSLIRFTTDQKPAITNLGQLIDGKKNGPMSVQNQCSSWGGDMVGDSYGNLYLVTYRNYMYKINPQTRIADFLGQLKGLPAGFTSNGMVVDNDGNVVVSSATMSDNYYRVNISTLEAVTINKKEDKIYNSSDLANSNLLYQNKTTADKFTVGEVKGNQAVTVFPNPAINKSFTLQFDKVPAGRYNLVLSDAAGRSVLQKSLVISSKGQTERLSLPRTSNGGMYLIKLTGGNQTLVYSDKIVVQ